MTHPTSNNKPKHEIMGYRPLRKQPARNPEKILIGKISFLRNFDNLKKAKKKKIEKARRAQQIHYKSTTECQSKNLPRTSVVPI